MKISEYIKGAVLKEFKNSFSVATGYKEWFETKPDEPLLHGHIELQAETLEIPYNGKILRITVSEWGSVELIGD